MHGRVSELCALNLFRGPRIPPRRKAVQVVCMDTGFGELFLIRYKLDSIRGNRKATGDLTTTVASVCFTVV